MVRFASCSMSSATTPMRSAAIPTSALKAGFPVPSTTRPFSIRMSSMFRAFSATSSALPNCTRINFWIGIRASLAHPGAWVCLPAKGGHLKRRSDAKRPLSLRSLRMTFRLSEVVVLQAIRKNALIGHGLTSSIQPLGKSTLRQAQGTAHRR